MNNRAARRHPEHAPPPLPPALPTLSVPFQIGEGNTGGRVEISEFAARILIGVLNSIAVTGSKGKFEVGFAQRELEEGIAKLHPPPAQNGDAPAE